MRAYRAFARIYPAFSHVQENQTEKRRRVHVKFPYTLVDSNVGMGGSAVFRAGYGREFPAQRAGFPHRLGVDNHERNNGHREQAGKLRENKNLERKHQSGSVERRKGHFAGEYTEKTQKKWQ
jgi:hypothetical protein